MCTLDYIRLDILSNLLCTHLLLFEVQPNNLSVKNKGSNEHIPFPILYLYSQVNLYVHMDYLPMLAMKHFFITFRMICTLTSKQQTLFPQYMQLLSWTAMWLDKGTSTNTRIKQELKSSQRDEKVSERSKSDDRIILLQL